MKNNKIITLFRKLKGLELRKIDIMNELTYIIKEIFKSLSFEDIEINIYSYEFEVIFGEHINYEDIVEINRVLSDYNCKISSIQNSDKGIIIYVVVCY